MSEPESPKDVHIINELGQVKALTDPLRLRILEELCDAARTTKQVAEILGEKPTKLYHHMDALERSGLIRLQETRQKRGTLEKYFRAIALSFRTDPSLFTSGPPEASDPEHWKSVGATVLETTAQELRRLSVPKMLESKYEKEAVIAGLRIRVRPEDVQELRQMIKEWVEKAMECSEEGERRHREGAEDLEEFRLALAMYPVGETNEPSDG